MTPSSIGGTRRASTSSRVPRARTVVLLVVGYLAAFTVIADMRVHRLVANDFGLNIWGYRGAIARQVKTEDRRVVILGGALAFGSGLVLEETVPAYLQRNLHQPWRTGQARLLTTVINLAAPTDGPRSYLTTLRNYASLNADIVCLLGDPSRGVGTAEPWRHRSVLFRSTGYLPLLPSVLAGGLAAARPAALPSLTPSESSPGSGPADCTGELEPYCNAVTSTVEYALRNGMRVVFAKPPVANERERLQEDALAAELRARFGSTPAFLLVDVSDAPVAMPPTARDTDRIADTLTTPILELMR